MLSHSGHIQSLLNPPGNPKAFFQARPARKATAEAWLKGAEKRAGSWWPHWLEWIKPRSGQLVAAPAAFGNVDIPPLGEAPGRYVMEN